MSRWESRFFGVPEGKVLRLQNAMGEISTLFPFQIYDLVHCFLYFLGSIVSWFCYLVLMVGIFHFQENDGG